MADYVFHQLGKLISEITPDSVISRTVFQDDRIKVTVFGFAAGQGMTEHTSTKTAIIHVLQGEATVTLGDDIHQVSAGSWIHLSPNLKHSIMADSKMQMLLTILK